MATSMITYSNKMAGTLAAAVYHRHIGQKLREEFRKGIQVKYIIIKLANYDENLSIKAARHMTMFRDRRKLWPATELGMALPSWQEQQRKERMCSYYRDKSVINRKRVWRALLIAPTAL